MKNHSIVFVWIEWRPWSSKLLRNEIEENIPGHAYAGDDSTTLINRLINWYLIGTSQAENAEVSADHVVEEYDATNAAPQTHSEKVDYEEVMSIY